jgi:hypothetical protein
MTVPWVSRLQVDVRLAARQSLDLDYRLQADLDRIRTPPPLAPERVDGLWQHTCFEAFIGSEDATEYFEFNFAPSGQWQAFAFRDYRQGCRLLNAEMPPIGCTRATKELLVSVKVELPSRLPLARLQIGLCAVLENVDGNLSYWALKHGSGKADFHAKATHTLRSKNL